MYVNTFFEKSYEPEFKLYFEIHKQTCRVAVTGKQCHLIVSQVSLQQLALC